MTEFTCPKHGNIGKNVLNTHHLFRDAALVGGVVNLDIAASALPDRQLVCMRCASELIDAAFPPVRERPKK